MDKPKVGRPKKIDCGEPSRLRESFSFDEQQHDHLAARINTEFGNLSSTEIGVLLSGATNAANWFAAGFFPERGRRGRIPETTKAVLLYECKKAMESASGNGLLWQRSADLGGGDSDATKLARIIIEVVTRKPYPYDLRRMISGAKYTAG